MRFLPQIAGHGGKQFNESTRPPLDKLPNALADAIRERDRIMAQKYAAEHHKREIGTEQVAEAARQTDDAAAAKAARAGKPIPAPTALPKLEADRAKAAHAAQAQEAAFVAIDGECDTVASDLWWADLEKRAGERADIRADIAAKAAALADAVEAAVDQFAVADWQRHGIYNRTTMTWPTEIINLERYGLHRKNTTPINVRQVIINAATTCLDEPAEK
jgi:hypothetical protein